MKKLLLLLSCFVMVFAAHAQQPSQENTSYPLDPQATAAAPWKVGETIAEKPCFSDRKTTCHCKFLGITSQGKALLQEFYASGQKATEPYTATVLPETKEQRRDGLYIAFYENGQKAGEGHFLDGKAQGLWTEWHRNGQKAAEGHYQDGKEQGLATSWYENGQKAAEGHTQDGKPQGLWTWWHSNGQKMTEGHFQDGIKQGLWTWWHENGQKSEEGHFLNDKGRGLWTRWDENGNIIAEKKVD